SKVQAGKCGQLAVSGPQRRRRGRRCSARRGRALKTAACSERNRDSVALSFAKTSAGGQVVDLSTLIQRQSRSMITLLLHLLRVLPLLFGSHRHLALENLALRQQLAVYKRTVSRPKLRTMEIG